jgi:hypothetical protein
MSVAAGLNDSGTHHGNSDSRDSDDMPSANGLGAAQAKALLQQTPALHQEAANTPVGGTVMQAVPVAYTHNEAPKSTVAATAAAPTAPITEPPVAPTVKPHAIDVRVPGAGDNHVDVRVSQRAGDVEVSVRTQNSELAQSLRQHLPELSDRLSQTGVDGTILRPAAMDTANSNSATPDNDSGGYRQGQQQQQEQQAEQQSDSQNRRNQWFNEFYNAEQEGR